MKGSDRREEDLTINSQADLATELHRLVRDAEHRSGRSIGRAGLAKRIGVSTSSLYAYLNGTTLIPADALVHLLRELGIDARQTERIRRVRDSLTMPTSIAPQTLPLDVETFTGRPDYLAKLDLLRKKGRKNAAVVISAVSGIGGIGKTSLAIHWAHLRRNRFPDGCLYLDLRGFHPDTPLQPAEAVAALLRRLGLRGSSIPLDQDERVLRYQELLAGKRMLILLDNAFSAEQVRPLLPPGTSNCFVVITSRDRLTGLVVTHGAHSLLVDTLPDHEAHALFAARLGHERLAAEPAAVADILGFCAGLPLALCIVSGQAHTNPHTTLTSIAEELRETRLAALDNGDPAASMSHVLSWSFNALTDDQARLLKFLGIAPRADISVAAAANLTNLATDRTRRLLRTLEHVSLVHQEAPGRYRMHDLVHLYATDQGHRDYGESTREAALRRLVDFYLHTAIACDRQLSPNRQPVRIEPSTTGANPVPIGDATVALTWLDAEHTCLLAAQRLTTERQWHDKTWLIAWALGTFHWRRGYLQQDLEAWELGAAAAAELDNPTAQIRAHRRLGDAYMRLRQPTAAREHLELALDLAENTADLANQARAHHELSRTWEVEKDYRRALEHAVRATEAFHILGDPVREATALNHVGWYLAWLGEYDKAAESCEQALTMSRLHGDPEGEAMARNSLGHIARHTGRHREAINSYRQAQLLFNKLGWTYYESETLEQLGHTYLLLGETDNAGREWQQALRLFQAQHRNADSERVRQLLHALKKSQR